MGYRDITSPMADPWTDTLNLTVQGVTLLLGILGAIAFFRQRKGRWVRYLNHSVLRPWGKVELKRTFRDWSGRPAKGVLLLIPKVVMADLDRTVGDGGLEVADLEGIEEGKQFIQHPPLLKLTSNGRALRAACASALKEWTEIEGQLKMLEKIRERRRLELEAMIARDIAANYPGLRPTKPDLLKPETYVPANLLAKAEDDSGWSLRDNWPGVQVQQSRTSRGEGLTFDLMDNSYLMETISEEVAEPERLRRLMTAWVVTPSIHDAAKEVERTVEDLEDSLERFRRAMKQVTFSLDLRFGATE